LQSLLGRTAFAALTLDYEASTSIRALTQQSKNPGLLGTRNRSDV